LKRINRKACEIAAALVVSAVLFYFAFRDIDPAKIIGSLGRIDAGYLAAATAGVIFVQVLRALRWGVLLRPVATLDPNRLFAVTSIGFMFVVLLPARLGEMARPYLLRQNSGVSFSSALATIVLERILDAIFVLSLFALSLNFIAAPPWIINFAKAAALTLFAVVGLLAAGGSTTGSRAARKLGQRVLPPRLLAWLESAAETFYSGLSIVGNFRHLALCVVLSAAIWSVVVAINWLLFRALGIELGLIAAIVVLVFTMLGISVPAGPGFVGNYHFACLLALSFFDVSKEVAAAYAISLHAVSVGTVIFMGLLCLSLIRVNMSAMVWGSGTRLSHPGKA
jgi:uncharacterized protein (TIRG00374 family)